MNKGENKILQERRSRGQGGHSSPLLPHTHLFGKYLEKAELSEQRSINQKDKGMFVATFHSRSPQLGPTLHLLKTQAPPQHSDPHPRLCSIPENHGFHYWLHKFKQKTYLANSSEFILKIFPWFYDNCVIHTF